MEELVFETAAPAAELAARDANVGHDAHGYALALPRDAYHRGRRARGTRWRRPH